MTVSPPLPVILHVRVPRILEGRDHQRYLERKFRDFDLRLRPPPTLIGTDIPVGYGLVRPVTGKWDIVEARGEIPSRTCIIQLHQHELVEDVMDEALEEWRRAERAYESGRPPPEDDEPAGGFASGGPKPNRLTLYAATAAVVLLKPFTLLARGIRFLRRWYVREYG